MVLFTVIDSTGREIRLTEKQWSHICEHAEMIGEMENIKETILHPDTIVISPRDQHIHYHFRHYKEKRKYLLVAVKFLNGDGFIITSFYSSKIRI